MDKVSKEYFDKYFSLWSEHPIEYKGVTYKTGEHLYHSRRYDDPNIRKIIVESKDGEEAWTLSQKFKIHQQKDFDARKTDIMREILLAKFEQHPDTREVLIATGEAEIIKPYPDPFWGEGPDGRGQNVMGKILMEIRTEIRP